MAKLYYYFRKREMDRQQIGNFFPSEFPASNRAAPAILSRALLGERFRSRKRAKRDAEVSEMQIIWKMLSSAFSSKCRPGLLRKVRVDGEARTRKMALSKRLSVFLAPGPLYEIIRK